ncbi:MAG: hypothetical protein ACHQUC_05060, partial [Chlamydiales bacterium]
GDTKEDALIDAIKNFNKYCRCISKKIESLEKKSKILHIECDVDECFKNPIYPVETVDYQQNCVDKTYEFKKSGKFRNAMIYYDKNQVFISGD